MVSGNQFFMNGVDWPSPAANLSNVEEQIKKILAATGVDVPSLVAGGSSPATLPLPLAAFVSLTITYKLDKDSQRFLNLAGRPWSPLQPVAHGHACQLWHPCGPKRQNAGVIFLSSLLHVLSFSTTMVQ